MSNKEILIAKEQAELDNATAKFVLMKSIIRLLPDSLPMPERLYMGAYCGHASIHYKGKDMLKSVADALPAIPCVFVDGSSVSIKPIESLRDTDRGMRRKIYPVYVATNLERAATWWTHMGTMTVKILVEGVSIDDITDVLGEEAARYNKNAYRYSTGATEFFQLRRKSAQDLGLVSPIDRWEKIWYDWAEKKEMSANYKRVMNVFKTQVLNDIPLSSDRVTNSWKFFSKGDEENMIAFAQEQRASLPEYRQEVQDCMIKASKWFREFFASHGNPFPAYKSPGCGNLASDASEILDYLFHKETGLAGSIGWVSDKNGIAQVRYSLDTEFCDVDCSFQQGSSLDWESLAEYC